MASGTNFSVFSEVATRSSSACSTPTGRRRGLPAGNVGVHLSRLPAEHRAGPALRLSCAWAVGAGARASLQPEQAAARPVRQGCRRAGSGTRRCFPTVRRGRDSRNEPTARRSCRSRSGRRRFDWDDDRRRGRRGTRPSSTRRTSRASRCGIPSCRSTCAARTPGWRTPAAIDYLKQLGVTAVELLPVHQFVHDKLLLDRGLRNYWGYNSIGFFAPHADTRPAARSASRCTSSSRW